jgi:hypothetical protein
MITGLTINKNCSITNVNDNVIILNLDSGKYFTTDNVGSFIWEKLLSNNVYSMNEIFDMTVEIYDIDICSVRDDINFFLKELLKNEIIFIDK